MIYSISAIYKKTFTSFRKKSMKTRIIKNIFNKNERRCRDVKTQKASKQGWEANLGPKIKKLNKPLPYNPT